MFLIFRFGKAEPSSKHKRHCQRVEVMLSAGPLNTALVLMGSRHVRDIYALHRCLLHSVVVSTMFILLSCFFFFFFFSFCAVFHLYCLCLYLNVLLALHILRIINYLSFYLLGFSGKHRFFFQMKF